MISEQALFLTKIFKHIYWHEIHRIIWNKMLLQLYKEEFLSDKLQAKTHRL